MANEIKAKHGASVAMTITLASLASSTVGVGRQSTLVNNEDTAQFIRVFFKITTGTSPTDNRSIKFHLITGDDPASPAIRTDGAGASDAGLTIEGAPLVNVAQTDDTTDKTYQGSFLIRNPGKEWGVAVVHDTGVNLNSTGSNHEMRFITENTEVQ